MRASDVTASRVSAQKMTNSNKEKVSNKRTRNAQENFLAEYRRYLRSKYGLKAGVIVPEILNATPDDTFFEEPVPDELMSLTNS